MSNVLNTVTHHNSIFITLPKSGISLLRHTKLRGRTSPPRDPSRRSDYAHQRRRRRRANKLSQWFSDVQSRTILIVPLLAKE